MKLTIIIPVYKVEAYLNFCLKSIARQNVEDYEVILVGTERRTIPCHPLP